MKNKILALLFLIAFQPAFSQTSKTTYWIIFRDKRDSPYSINNPGAFLSERSISRREKQHIRIKERDLPVNVSYVRAITNYGAVVKTRSKWFNGISVSLSDESKIEVIKGLPFVKSVQKIEA